MLYVLYLAIPFSHPERFELANPTTLSHSLTRFVMGPDRAQAPQGAT